MVTAQVPGPLGEIADTSRLEKLRQRASFLRVELKQVEQEIEAEQAKLKKIDDASLGTQDKPGLHKRPSYSLLGGADSGTDGILRQLDAKDEDFKAVLADHPELRVGPIGHFNHWDRRECAVQNASDWKERCSKYMKDLGGVAEIPKVIHQIWIGPREPPCLWIDTFRNEYCNVYKEWTHELWSDEQVAKLPMINADIYSNEKMWQCKADILRLEFLWHHGGLYVDADMVSVGNKNLDQILELGKETGFVIAYEPDTKDKPYSILGNSVIACTPHHPLILMLILYLKQTFYQKRNVEEVFAVTGPVMYTKCLVDSGMAISLAAQELLYPAFHFVPNPDTIDYSHFPRCLMFQFGYTCSGLEGYVKRRNRCRCARTCPFHKKVQLLDSYRKLGDTQEQDLFKQVPIAMTYLEDYAKSPADDAGGLPLDDGVATFLTDGELVQLDQLRRESMGYLEHIRNQGQGFDVILVGIEFQTGSDETAIFPVPPGGRPRDSMVCGLLVNVAGNQNSSLLKSTLKACIGEKGFDPTALFNAADRLSIWFGVQKYRGSMDEARLWRSMPKVQRIFNQLANHDPPLHCEHQEVNGNLVKGHVNGYVAYELRVEANGDVIFRSWNDDNSPNCELKTSGSKVEWMKVFFNHQVCFEAHGREIP